MVLAQMTDTGRITVAADNGTNSSPSISVSPMEIPVHAPLDLIDDPIVLGLRRLYDSVLDEAVPSDFLDLLAQIDATLAHGVEEAKSYAVPQDQSTHDEGAS
jgi:hypothetical protein